MPRQQQNSDQVKQEAEKSAKFASLKVRIGSDDFDWLCQTLLEDAEREARRAALKDRIGPKVFDWLSKILTESSSQSRPCSQDNSFTSSTQSAQSSPEAPDSTPLSSPPSITSLKRKATDSKADAIDRRKSKKAKEEGCEFRPERSLKRKLVESDDEVDDQEVGEPVAKKTKENGGGFRAPRRSTRKIIMSDDEEDDDVASAPKEKAEMNKDSDSLSSKDTQKAVVPAAPKPSYFSLKAAKHKHGERPTQSIFARGPDRDYESVVTSTQPHFRTVESAREVKVLPKDDVPKSAPMFIEDVVQQMKNAREIADRLGKFAMKLAKPAVPAGQFETSTVEQGPADQAAGSERAVGKPKSQPKPVESDGPTKSAQPIYGQAPSQEATQSRAPVSYKGLTNDRYRCYQNATYQNLANLPGLVRHLDSLGWAQHDPDSDPNLKPPQAKGKCRAATSERETYRKELRRVKSSLLVTPRVRKAFKNLRDRSTANAAVCARSIGEVLACVDEAENWNGDSQEDAAEFQHTLLRRLEEEEMEESGASSNAETDIHRLFRGEMKQTVECSGCGYKSEQTAGSSSLTLEVANGLTATTFQTLLTNHFRPERLDDYRCERCEKKGLISKTYRWTELPDYLVVTLNRTQQLSVDRFVKNRAKVSISTSSLNVADFCDQSCDSGRHLYSICGLVQHVGKFMDKGHYTAVCRGQDGVWREFDDNKVKSLNPEEVAGYDQAQTVFLRRRG